VGEPNLGKCVAPISRREDVSRSDRTRIYALSAAMLSFVANDAIVKYLGQLLPTIQVIFVRGVISSMMLLCLVRFLNLRPSLAGLRNQRVVLRSTLDALATVAYLSSLSWLPIGNATAINMAAPMLLVLLAVLVMRQTVDVGRWLAIATGFGGVILIVQPRVDALNGYALLCLLGTFLHACRDLVTRGIDSAIPSVIVTLSTSLFVTLLAGLWVSFSPWVPVTWTAFWLLCAAATLLCVGYLLITISMRGGDVSIVAPFRYTGLVFALALGWLVWGEAPNAAACAGIAVLFCAGGYLLRSESKRKHPELESHTD
jgi:drug/metabolite transporter (DMT)-like permease